jgi:hypothetical protein
VQSGYLTFKGIHEELGYLLGYPNREVQDSFSSLILQSTFNIQGTLNNKIMEDVVLGFEGHDFERVFLAMNRTLANIPGKLYDSDYPQKEAYYHTILLTLLWACNLHVHAEEWTSRGLSDLVLEYHEDVWVIELKTSSAQTAMNQIKDRGYGDKYANAHYLAYIAISIDIEKRTLKDYFLEEQVSKS